MKVKVAQLCPTLCDPMDCSLPGSSVNGILQARILEWVAIPFSRGSSQPRDPTQVSCSAGGFFTVWTTKQALLRMKSLQMVKPGLKLKQFNSKNAFFTSLLCETFSRESSDSWIFKWSASDGSERNVSFWSPEDVAVWWQWSLSMLSNVVVLGDTTDTWNVTSATYNS